MLIKKQKRKQVDKVYWKENITENLEVSPENANDSTDGPPRRLWHKSLSPWASRFTGSITVLGPVLGTDPKQMLGYSPCIGFHGLDQSYSLLWKFGKNLLLSFRTAGQGSKNLAKDIIQTCVWSRESLAVNWNSLNYSPGWLWALDLPVSASWVVRPQACRTMPRFWKSNPHSISNEGSLTSWKAFWLPL